MEKFKKFLPGDQQKDRSERTKNNSRSLSPHDGIRPRSTTFDRESHTSAESPVNTLEESGDSNPNCNGAKKTELVVGAQDRQAQFLQQIRLGRKKGSETVAAHAAVSSEKV
jgi:hypothetical protein